jgi:hypothetical protein
MKILYEIGLFSHLKIYPKLDGSKMKRVRKTYKKGRVGVYGFILRT